MNSTTYQVQVWNNTRGYMPYGMTKNDVVAAKTEAARLAHKFGYETRVVEQKREDRGEVKNGYIVNEVVV